MKKRIISLLLIFVMILGLLPTSAFAASTESEALGEVDIYNGDYSLSYLSINGTVRTLEYTYFNFVNNRGQQREVPAYCVNPNIKGVPQTVKAGESIKYLANERASDPKVVGIISNGYPHRGLSELGLENKYQAYYATKMALWCYLLSHWDINNLKINPNLSGVEKERAQKILAAAKQIYTRGVTWASVPTPRLTTETDRSSAYPVTINGTDYIQQVFTVTSETWVCDYDIAVSFTDPASVPSGTKIVDMDNREITAITTEATGKGYAGQFKVLYPAGSVNGESGGVQLSFSADVYQYAALYAVCAETGKYGQLQNYICDVDITKHIDQNAVSSYSGGSEEVNELETGLIITKLEAGTDTPLEGAVFSVTGPDGEPVGSFSSSYAGTVTLPLTLAGVYTVTEEVAPAFHLLPEQRTQQVTVRYGEVARLTFSNEAYGALSVQKISDTGENLSGVTVQIKHIESGTVSSGQTNAAGIAYFDQLKPGAYEVRETAGILGWQADTDTVQTVSVPSGGEADVTITNKELPGLRIIKYERGSMKLMSDVSFEVFRDTVSLGIFKTDEMGEILLPNCQSGTYRVEERNTGGDSHVLTTTPQEVELKAGDGIKQLVFFNDRLPGIHLVKVDSSDLSKPIANAKFSIKSVDDSYGPKEFTTTEEGVIDLSKLPVGAYVVTELSCPGYVVDDAQRIIQLDGGEQAQFVFTNSKLPSLHLTKESADGTPLGGVTFHLAKIADGSRYLDRTTSATGTITWDGLEPGVYSLKEVSTVSDHILDTKEYHVQLFPGKDATICLQNNKRPNLIIHKSDADDGSPIAGACFLVRTVDGHSVAEVETGTDGTAIVENLLPAVYEVIEKSVPSPYLKDAPSQLVTLYPNRDRDVYFENHKQPVITIKKENSVTHDPLSHVRFQVWYASNNTGTGELNDLGIFTTDENGEIHLTGPENGLKDGWFRVKELEPPTGFGIKDSDTQEAFVQAGKSHTFLFENIPLSALVVFKQDSATGKALAGCRFQLRYLSDSVSGTSGTVIGTYETGQNGSFTVTNLKAGSYICEEISSDSGHVIDTAPQTFTISGREQDIVTLYFGNSPKGSLILRKIDPTDGKNTPLEGAVFYVTDSTGAVIGTENGLYTTGSDGLVTISGITPGTTLIVREQQAPTGYQLDETPQSIYISNDGAARTLTFKNVPIGGVEIIKVNADKTSQRIPNTTFEIRAMDDELVDTVKTDAYGRVYVPLESGSYYAVEIEAANGFRLDSTPHYFEVTDGKVTSLTVKNKVISGILIHKIDSTTGKGIAGVSFLLYNSSHTPIGEYASDQRGYVYIDDLTDSGRYYLRELENEGYITDTALKTVYVKSGETTEIEWKNTPITGQIQIIKKSADYNPTTGLPAGTLLEGAVFEIADKAGNVVDTIRSNGQGLAVSKQLPLGRYTVRETKAPEHYGTSGTDLTAYLEHEGQILRFEVTNQSLTTGVSITKTGPKEIMAGQPVRYAFSQIGNTSNVSLSNFYWRDTLPAQVRLEKIVTGTYNFPGTYKIVYRVNGGDYRTLADNLSTAKNYTLVASSVALGLAANERVTEIMFVFGQAPAGFAQVEAPYLYCTAVSSLAAGSFVNVADVGGTYNGTWVQAVSRWVISVYGKSTAVKLPKTGY